LKFYKRAKIIHEEDNEVPVKEKEEDLGKEGEF